MVLCYYHLLLFYIFVLVYIDVFNIGFIIVSTAVAAYKRQNMLYIM